MTRIRQGTVAERDKAGELRPSVACPYLSMNAARVELTQTTRMQIKIWRTLRIW